MRIRVRFEKTGNMRFIGHLDILRYFQKAFQRADIPVKYSEGFHPHPVMSFASPLSVGLTSTGEYMDTELTEEMSSREFLTRLNAVMAEGMKVTECRRLPEDIKKKNNNAMALVGLADYRGKLRLLEGRPAPDASEIRRFLTQPEVLAVRHGKHKTEEIDILPRIHAFSFEENTNSYYMRLAASSAANLKPETVMEAFLRFAGREELMQPVAASDRRELPRDVCFDICRLDMLTEEGRPLGDLGEDILSL